MTVLLSVLARLVAAGAVAVGLAWALRRPPQVTATVSRDELTLRFHGWDAFWALRREVVVPLHQVQRVDAVPLSQVPRPTVWFRIGTDLPGVIRAGSFGRGSSRELWDVRRGGRVVLVELRPGLPYQRVVLQVADPDAIAEQLRAAMASA